jgi:hypothetical protein
MKRMKLNATWHLAHPMPKNPSLAQRIAWHLEHVQHCACRPIPAKLLEEMERQQIQVPPHEED